MYGVRGAARLRFRSNTGSVPLRPGGDGTVAGGRGVSVDATTGRISGTINASGTTTFTVSASNGSGTGTDEVSLRRIDASASIPVAVEAPATPIETGPA